MMRNLTRNDDGSKAEGFSFGAENIRENVWLEFSILKPHVAVYFTLIIFLLTPFLLREG